jgi:cyclohexadieny/prephenate dehydrogenase
MTDPASLPVLTILAPGLLGASLGAAAKAAGLVGRVQVWARRAETIRELECCNWCDEASMDMAQVVKDADLIWVCAPVNVVARLVGQLAAWVKPTAVVTDVGSTKGRLVQQCESALGGAAAFVGSHPMAGSQKSGLSHADAQLYADRPCFVTPTDCSDPAAVETIRHFWEAMGMRVYEVAPDEHDRIVASISHAPHLVAASLAATLAEAGAGQWTHFVGTGLRDTTRIAAGSVEMWMDILLHNREQIVPVLAKVIDGLEHLKTHLEHGQFNAVEQVLRDGKRFRESLE